MDILQQYLILLLDCFKFDISVFSNVWLYVPLCIPAMIYCGFFFLKWLILTAPLWLPVAICAGAIRGNSALISIKSNK